MTILVKAKREGNESEEKTRREEGNGKRNGREEKKKGYGRKGKGREGREAKNREWDGEGRKWKGRLGRKGKFKKQRAKGDEIEKRGKRRRKENLCSKAFFSFFFFLSYSFSISATLRLLGLLAFAHRTTVGICLSPKREEKVRSFLEESLDCCLFS